MKNNNTYNALNNTFKKLQRIPYEYGVLMYMILKQELCNKREIKKIFADNKNNYLLIDTIINHIIVACSDPAEITDDIHNTAIIIKTLKTYFLALTETNSSGIGLNEEEPFEKNFSILLYNSIYHRLLEMSDLAIQCRTQKETYQMAFDIIQSFLTKIKMKDKEFRQYIFEYKEALQDYDLFINYGFDYDDEDSEITDCSECPNRDDCPDYNHNKEHKEENFYDFDEGDFLF